MERGLWFAIFAVVYLDEFGESFGVGAHHERRGVLVPVRAQSLGYRDRPRRRP